MDEATLTDLKLFITGAISQQTASLHIDIRGLQVDMKSLQADVQSLDTKIDALDKRLNDKIDDLSLAVAEALEQTNDLMQQQFDDHELRITRVERRTQ